MIPQTPRFRGLSCLVLALNSLSIRLLPFCLAYFLRVLCVYRFHHFLLIASTGCRVYREDLIDLVEFITAQFDVYSGSIFFYIFRVLRSWDGDDILTLCKNPS